MLCLQQNVYRSKCENKGTEESQISSKTNKGKGKGKGKGIPSQA